MCMNVYGAMTNFKAIAILESNTQQYYDTYLLLSVLVYIAYTENVHSIIFIYYVGIYCMKYILKYIIEQTVKKYDIIYLLSNII